MCGRFTLTTPAQRLADQFELAGELPEVTPSYNIAPTREIAAVAADSEGYRQLHELHWGLIPRCSKDPEIGSRMINARAETVAEKNSFKSAFRKRRVPDTSRRILRVVAQPERLRAKEALLHTPGDGYALRLRRTLGELGGRGLPQDQQHDDHHHRGQRAGR